MIFATKRLISLFFFIMLGAISIFAFPNLSLLFFALLFLPIILFIIDTLLLPKKSSLNIIRTHEQYLSIGQANKIKLELSGPIRDNLKIQICDLYPSKCTVSQEIIKTVGIKKMSYDLIPHVRGKFYFNGTQIRIYGIFCLAGKQYNFIETSEVVVYPDIISLKKFLHFEKKRRQNNLGYNNQSKTGEAEFDYLREYVVGDTYRHINWKATAKYGYPITRVHRKEFERDILVILDCGRMMTTSYKQLTKLDYAINTSLLIAAKTIQNHDKFGFVAFDNNILTYLKPEKSQSVYQKILSKLNTIQPSSVKSDYDKLYNYMNKIVQKNTVIIMFSELYNSIVSKDLYQFLIMLSKKHSVNLISFDETEKYCVDETNLGIARFSLQLGMNAEKIVMGSSLKQKGVSVIQVNHKNINEKSIETLSRNTHLYNAIF